MIRRTLRILRYIPQSLIIAVPIVAALIFQPWVLLDPIDRFSHLDSTPRSMIPAVFAAGEPIADAVDRLSRSGYRHHAIEPANQKGFTDFFRKSNVATNFACTIDHVVWIKRESNQVAAARNEVYSLCL